MIKKAGKAARYHQTYLLTSDQVLTGENRLDTNMCSLSQKRKGRPRPPFFVHFESVKSIRCQIQSHQSQLRRRRHHQQYGDP